MEWQVNADIRVAGTEHIKGVPEEKDLLVAVPTPVRVRVGEMPPAGAMGKAALETLADLVTIRGGMGMDAGAVSGKGDAVGGEEAIPDGREQGGKAEQALEALLIMEGKLFMGEGVCG